MRSTFTLTAAALVMLVAGSAMAQMDPSGLAGRFYIGGRFTDANTNKFFQIQSFAIGSDWSVTDYQNHGMVSDIHDSGDGLYGQSSHLVMSMTPFIAQSNPTGYAKLFLNDFWANGTFPGQDRPADYPIWGTAENPDMHTMGALYFTPTNGGNTMTVATPGISGITDQAKWIFPDPQGAFGGTPGSYWVSQHWGGNVITNIATGAAVGSNAGLGNAFESAHLYGKFVYSRSVYGTTYRDGIVTSDTAGNSHEFISDGIVLSYYANCTSDFGIGTVTVNSQPATAVYAFGLDSTVGMYRVLDTNNDGVAESSTLFLDGASIPNPSHVTKIQVVPGGGKNYLMLMEPVENQIVVLGMNADGTYSGQQKTLILPAGTLNAAGLTYTDFSVDWASAAPPPTFTAGDADMNGYVDDNDLNVVLSNWGAGSTWAQGDFDKSGSVDDNDLNAVLSNWTGAPAAAPEPITLSLLAIGGVALLRRRK